MKTKRKSLPLRIIAVCTICALDLLCGVGYLYYVNMRGGTLFYAIHASDNICGTLRQGLIVAACPFLLFLISLSVLKKDFGGEMYLHIRGKRQALTIVLLISVLAIMTVAGLIFKDDKVTILYNLFYYLVLIAFTEEFVVRGLCVYLLKDFSWKVRYLIPNVVFGIMHIFAYSNYRYLSPNYIIHFLGSNLLGLLAAGCLFQFLKEKSGTLWVPILIHAICDYSVIFSY